MPVARYFLFVGGALLALLFALDIFVPQQAAVASNTGGIDKTVVRIRSDQKPPERVVYDMTLPTIVPPVAQTQMAAAPAPVTPVADLNAQARVRDTFAQFVPAEAKKMEKQADLQQAPRKRKVARVAKSRSAQPMRFAQQQHFGFFGNTW